MQRVNKKLQGMHMITIKKFAMIIGLVFITILSSDLLLSQDDYQFFETDDEYQQVERQDEEDRSHSSRDNMNATWDSDPRFYDTHPYRWPKVTIFKSASAVVIYVCILFGFLIFVIGWYGGARLNKAKVITTMIVATGVGVIGRSFIIMIQLAIYNFLKGRLGEIAAGTIAESVIYVFWILFISGISVFLYETMIVTAREAHPMT